MKISFIIPVYHVEQYLEQCIQSVLKAWEKEKEILLIIGDSSDQSNMICYQYQKEWSEIFVYIQDGKGLSNARNYGLKKITGNYVLFIDGDDYINSETLKKRFRMLEKLEEEKVQKVDLLVSDYIAVKDSKCILRKSQQIDKSTEFQIEERVTKQFFKAHGSIWNVWRYIYCTEFLRKNKITFLENTANEDVLFTTQVFLKASRIAYLHLPYYHYRVRRQGALTTQIDQVQVYDFLNIIKKCMIEVKNSLENKRANNLKEKLQREYLLNLPLIYEVDRKDRKKVGTVYCKYRWILKDSEQIKYRFLYWWMCFFGVDILAWCFYKIREIRRKNSGIYKKFP